MSLCGYGPFDFFLPSLICFSLHLSLTFEFDFIFDFLPAYFCFYFGLLFPFPCASWLLWCARIPLIL